MKPKVVVLILTIFFMRIFHPIYTAAAEHHLVLCQSSRLIREQILDLTQVLSDVEGPALDPGVQLLVIQGQVVVDEVDLAQLHNLNGHVERDGDQHLLDRNWLHLLRDAFIDMSSASETVHQPPAIYVNKTEEKYIEPNELLWGCSWYATAGAGHVTKKEEPGSALATMQCVGQSNMC